MTALYNVLEKERRASNQDGHKGPARTWTKRSTRFTSRDSSASSRNCTTTWTPPSHAPTEWDVGLPEETILQRLVTLNAERRAEKEEGYVRYLRPAYQAPETVETQAEMDLDLDIGGDGAPAEPLDWPSDLKAQAQAVRAVTTHADEPLTVEEVAQHFHRARRPDVQALLETLAALGHVKETDDSAYAA